MVHQNKAHKPGSTICSGLLASRQEETWGKMIFQISPQIKHTIQPVRFSEKASKPNGTSGRYFGFYREFCSI